MSRQPAKETSDREQIANTAAPPSSGQWHETASGERLRIDSVVRPRRWLELPGHLSAIELKRRLWHMSPGLLPIASYIYPHKDPLSPTFRAIALGLIVGISALLLWRFKTIRRSGEQSELSELPAINGSFDHLAVKIRAVTRAADGDAVGIGRRTNRLRRGEHLPSVEEADEGVIFACHSDVIPTLKERLCDEHLWRERGGSPTRAKLDIAAREIECDLEREVPARRRALAIRHDDHVFRQNGAARNGHLEPTRDGQSVIHSTAECVRRITRTGAAGTVKRGRVRWAREEHDRTGQQRAEDLGESCFHGEPITPAK